MERIPDEKNEHTSYEALRNGTWYSVTYKKIVRKVEPKDGVPAPKKKPTSLNERLDALNEEVSDNTMYLHDSFREEASFLRKLIKHVLRKQEDAQTWQAKCDETQVAIRNDIKDFLDFVEYWVSAVLYVVLGFLLYKAWRWFFPAE